MSGGPTMGVEPGITLISLDVDQQLDNRTLPCPCFSHKRDETWGPVVPRGMACLPSPVVHEIQQAAVVLKQERLYLGHPAVRYLQRSLPVSTTTFKM